MATITAQNILDENNYTVADISLVNLAALIDNAINYVNLRAGLSMTTTVGGSVTLTGNQSVVVKLLSTLMLRAYLDRGPNTGLGGLSVNSVITDPQYALYSAMIEAGILSLTGSSTSGNTARSFLVTQV
jgi:hypothetical protein